MSGKGKVNRYVDNTEQDEGTALSREPPPKRNTSGQAKYWASFQLCFQNGCHTCACVNYGDIYTYLNQLPSTCIPNSFELVNIWSCRPRREDLERTKNESKR